MGMVWVARLVNDAEVSNLRANPDQIYDFVNSLEAYEGGKTIDLDKQWHGVHHLLTGSGDATDGPLSLIVADYEKIGPDRGYGPAWIIPATAIRAFHEALAATTDEDLVRRFDPEAMDREYVYLSDLFVEEGNEALPFLLSDVGKLRKFAGQAAEQGLQAIALIT